MKMLAVAIVVALALACVLREACRRAVRVAIVAYARACEAVVAFANPSPVVADVEREPTVSERLQRLLTASDVRADQLRMLGCIVETQQETLVVVRETAALRAEMAAADELARVEADLARWRNMWDRRRAVGIPVH